MLHEILLSLAGHRSPLLGDTYAADDADYDDNDDNGRLGLTTTLTPPEQDLLADLARLADLHVRLRTHAARIAAEHASVVCRAVAAAIVAEHLAAFQRDVLAVEDTILRKDAALVGAYDAVPLTAVVAAFADWPRRMEWLWAVATFILPVRADADADTDTDKSSPATSALLMDHLRAELQTGYADIEAAARSLVTVAETAWLKQVAAWMLYGRLPGDTDTETEDDFFVHQTAATADTAGSFVCRAHCLPAFVAPATAASMLFVGRSLVHLRAKTDSRSANGPRARHWLGDDASVNGGSGGHLSSQLPALAQLTFPLDAAAFARTVAHIRAFLSRTALRKLLPPGKVVDMLQLLRDFFLLGRGAFAMALVEQADATLRRRWQRADASLAQKTLTPSAARGLKAVVVKDGEVAAVLARAWAVLGAMHGRLGADDGADEDEGMELARETLRLVLHKASSAAASAAAATDTFTTPHNLRGARQQWLTQIAATPFQNLLFSVPASLTLQIPYPLDLVLSTADLQAYAAVHAYLLSIRRAHIRLTGLWTLSALRRHHPAPPPPPYGGTTGRVRPEHVRLLRARHAERSSSLRSVWATASAAIFFFAELEGYLQMEVVVELWDGFRAWLRPGVNLNSDDDDDDDIWMAEANETNETDKTDARDRHNVQTDDHDPQSLATAHRRYLRELVRRLLLDQGPRWTEPLYALLGTVDALAALVTRLQGLWQAMDLEADAGVVDDLVDLQREEADALHELRAAERSVRQGVLAVVAVLRALEREADEGAHELGGDDDADVDLDMDGGGPGLRAPGAYVPRRIGGLDRLLMKLDFGSWGG